MYNFIFNNKNLPEDLVPYWDYDAPNIPNEPRDASAAACTASALYELDGYLPGDVYKRQIIHSPASFAGAITCSWVAVTDVIVALAFFKYTLA